MLLNKVKIIVGDYSFAAVVSCEITEDVSTLTDTCTIEVPALARWEESDVVPVKKGDAVMVYAGYSNPVLRFVGHVRKVGTGSPLKLECEDQMYSLKQTKVEQTAIKDCTLTMLLRYLLPQGMPFKVIDDVALGNYRVTANTVAQELDNLSSAFGLKSYFRYIDGKPTLYSGLFYPVDGVSRHVFAHGHNLTVSGYDLSYQRAEEVKVRVKAISIQEDNSRLEVEAGDQDGELFTVYMQGGNIGDLKKFADSQVQRFRYTGLKGTFDALGEPVVHKADIVELKVKGRQFEEYRVKKVTCRFGAGIHYQQMVELGPPVNI